MAQPDPPGGNGAGGGNATKDTAIKAVSHSASASQDAQKTASISQAATNPAGDYSVPTSNPPPSSSGDHSVPTPNPPPSTVSVSSALAPRAVADADTTEKSSTSSSPVRSQSIMHSPRSPLASAPTPPRGDISHPVGDGAMTTGTRNDEISVGDMTRELQQIEHGEKSRKSQQLQAHRESEEAHLPPVPVVPLENPNMQDLTPVEKSKKVQKLVSHYRWSDVDDDEELSRKLDVQMSNPWLALDPDTVLPVSQQGKSATAVDERRGPLVPFKDIPNAVKATGFYTIITKPGDAQYVITNGGSHGSKNCHTTVIFDGGQHGCPMIRFHMQLSINPAQMVDVNEANNFALRADLPCGPIQMARGLFRAFAEDKFTFDSAHKPKYVKKITQAGFEILRRVAPKNATMADVEKCMNGCAWNIGGGVVLDGFDSEVVQRIKAHPELYHAEAAQNIAGIEQFCSLGGLAEITFVLGGNKEQRVASAHSVLECLQHSINNGHIMHHQYLDSNGNFTWEMPHIKQVGDGMNVVPPKPNHRNPVESFKTKPVDNAAQGLHSFMIAKACADLRELQYQEAGQNELAIHQHRAFVVATSPRQLGERAERDGDALYIVYVTLSSHGYDLNKLKPEPASILSINWENTAKAQFEDPRKRWTGPVIHLPDHELHGCHFAMFATAQQDSVAQKAYDNIEAAKQAGGLPVHLAFQMYNRISPKLKDAFKQMFRPDFRKFALLLMGRYDEAAKVPRNRNKILFPVKGNEFEDRTDEEIRAWQVWGTWIMTHNSEEGPTKWCLNTEQLLALSTLSNTESLKIVRGPPGTGKSLTGGCAVWAALAASNFESRVLVVASSNEATDAIASKVVQSRPIEKRMKDALIIRLHVEGAEFHHAQTHSDREEHALAERRGGQESERLRNLKATFQLATLQDFTPERMKNLSSSAKQAHQRHIAKYGLSLAEAIWKESNVTYRACSQIPEQQREPEDQYALEAAILYREAVTSYQGGIVDTQDEERFRDVYQFFAKIVLTKASVVITTCVNAASKNLVKWFRPDYLFVDEAGQVPDTELIIAATAFRGLRQIVLLGDPTQLQPTVTSNLRNEFSGARKSTFVARALLHVDSKHLVRQYRMTPPIAYPVSQLFYQGQLENAEGLEVPTDFVLTVRRFISEHFWKGERSPDKTEEVLFVDVPNSRSWKDEDGESSINVPEASCAVDIVQALCHFDTAVIKVGMVAIIAMYKAQAVLIRKKLADAIGAAAASVEVLDISTVDSFMGKENRIILLSLVLHGNDNMDQRLSNHLQDSHRLCVAISRARFGFFVIGNFWGLKTSTDPRLSRNQIRRELPIHRLLLHYQSQGQVFRYGDNVYHDDSRQRLKADFQQQLPVSERDVVLPNDAFDVALGKRADTDSPNQAYKRRR